MSVSPLTAVTSTLPGEIAGRDTTPAARLGQKPLTGAALRNASPEMQRKEVAAQFEAILVRQLLKPTMTSMLGDEGAASGIYGDLLTDTFATQLTRGQGMGLGRVLEQQLSPRQDHRVTGLQDNGTTGPQETRTDAPPSSHPVVR